jgi:signal transduction histidine kinase
MMARPAILIVDDLDTNLVAFEATLSRSDIEIITAKSARAALQILLERSVALAIVDVKMPEIDGFELADLMRGTKKTRWIPIIFVTAASMDVPPIFKGYEVGAVDFIIKPVDDQILRSKVDVFVTLEKQRQQLLQADHMLEMFVGILGHDLRNPLSAIVMTARAHLKQPRRSALQDPLMRILRNCERMGKMIDQLLDVTRIRLGGGVSLRPAPADLRGIAEQVVAEMVENTNRLALEVSGDTTGTWDTGRLAQVLSNLVGNAIQHSPPGTPISISLNGTLEDTVLIEVTNSGPAIADNLRDVLFEPFHPSRPGGLGLGLYVCKQFVTAHGGTIELESRDDSETCFTVRLPRHSSEQSIAIAV